MTQFLKPFEAKAGGTTKVTNSATASAVASLPDQCNVVSLYNTSTTAVAFWRCQPVDANGNGATVAVADLDQPIPPGQLIRLGVPSGPKKFSVVASAADGSTYVSPGVGN